MFDYIRDIEEREYCAVERPDLYAPGPDGERPLSPVEIYRYSIDGWPSDLAAEREAERRAEEEREWKATEPVRKAIAKAIEEADRKEMNRQ